MFTAVMKNFRVKYFGSTASLFIIPLLCMISSANAQSTFSTHEGYEALISKTRSFAPLDDSAFGERVNLQDGALSFVQNDVVLDTNSGLKVAIGRKSTTLQQWTDPGFSVFGIGWDMDVPFMMGTFDTRDGWMDNIQNGRRCSTGVTGPQEHTGPYPNYYSLLVTSHLYSQGININMPGGGNEQLLKTNAQQTLPSDGNTYLYTTKSNWRVACLSTIKNGNGEGFTVTLPNGTTYFFDWMVKRNAKDLTDNGDGYLDNVGNSLPGNEWHLLAPLTDVFMFASKAVDRFGNTVTYTYDPAFPSRLISIQSNDGVQASIQYNPDGLVASITSAGRIWQYAYNSRKLTSLQLPDGKMWTFIGAFDRFSAFTPAQMNFWSDACSQMAGDMSASSPVNTAKLWSVSITNPSGAKADFTFRPLYHGTNNTPGTCAALGGLENLSFGVIGVASAYGVNSLHQKKITGPGFQDKVWDYSYTTSWSFESQCSSGCVQTSKTHVATNDGVTRRYTFGNSYHANMGQLLAETIEKNGVVSQSINHAYLVSSSGQLFPDNTGDIIRGSAYSTNGTYLYGNPFNNKHRPQSVRTSTLNGVTYTNQVNAFDSFARPIDVTRSNSSGTSKTELTQYVDNTNKWVLGQVGSVADVATGLIEQSNSYDPVTANLLTKSAFGVLQESYTYNADGTLATVKDGKNNTYTLANWKRGIPQLITAPNLTTQSGVVNDAGWLSSVTNQRGYTTGYTYDLMGRLASITPPTGDTVAWAGTTLSFTPLTTAIYGVPAGGWKHSISRGNYRKETYLDALYRPLVVREYDNANASGTQRFSQKSYDTLNREVFSAYPGISSGLTVGSRTEYDALGRVTASKADSELGVLTTTTEYLSGGGIKVTGPDGTSTTRTFRSLDTPSYEQMVQEVGPGGVTTSISRDGFGKPLTITRSGTDGLNISKQFAYDANQRLCMRTEPETGSSIIDYDAAGNVLWAANGQAVANPAVCNRAAAISTDKINYIYDALNRVTKTDVPSTTLDPTLTYLADGTVNTLVNGTATWAYTYNKLGKPVTETLTLGSRVNTISHAYDTLANEASLTYPNGTSVAYLPNALGQPTQAGSYATGLSYRASGFLTGMSYGNGATYSAKPNLRGLPARRLDMKGTTVITDELIGYDQDANPVCVRDSSTGNPGSRDFSYDARNRLVRASAPNQGWVSAEYQYDSQDNIKMARLGTRQYNYSYTGLNRLADIGQPGTAPVATNFGLLSCSDYSLLADIDSGTTGGTGTPGNSGGMIAILPGALNDGLTDEPYSETLSSMGGTGPYTYALTAGTLPQGLSLSGSTISGTPQFQTIKTFTITSTDSLGNAGWQAYDLSIELGGGGNEPLMLAAPMLLVGDTLKYAFTHDANGRMTAKGAQAYVYDELNRMTQVTTKESYLYDGHGRRVQVTKTSDGKLNYPIYSLDGKLLLEDNRQTLKRTEYIYAGGRLVAKRIQPITSTGANNGAATTTTIHTDFLGSPVAETNSAGTVTRVERYTPYGEPADMQLDVGPGFTGHATDVATGLTYMQQRYYDAEIGRFISPDPVGPEEDFVNHFNRYNYAQNNPVRYTDPDGREVRIMIVRETYTDDSVISRMTVTSDQSDKSFAGFSLEDRHAGPAGNKDPVTPGEYSAFTRSDGSKGFRIELKHTPNFKNVQIHVGNDTDDVMGCFAAGSTKSEDFVGGSRQAMKQIQSVVNADGSGKIIVEVKGGSKPPEPPPPPTPLKKER